LEKSANFVWRKARKATSDQNVLATAIFFTDKIASLTKQAFVHSASIKRIFTSLGLLLAGAFSHVLMGGTVGSVPQPNLAHIWNYLTFSSVLADRTTCPTFVIGHDRDRNGIRLSIINTDATGLFEPNDVFETNVISARLFEENGRIVEPTTLGKRSLNDRIGVNGTMQVITYFPWGINSLQECWIDVSVGAEQYWLELPYGFYRNPSAPLPPSIPGGAPRPISAVKASTPHDHLIHWQNANYNLGQTRNGLQLSLVQSNPVDTKSEIVLTKENASGSWNLNSPKTTVRIRSADKSVNNGRCVSLHFNDTDTERTETFSFGRSGSTIRSWGQIEITVDDKNYSLVVPSSLYEYGHGHVSVN
jgi:hypothetical protein